MWVKTGQFLAGFGQASAPPRDSCHFWAIGGPKMGPLRPVERAARRLGHDWATFGQLLTRSGPETAHGVAALGLRISMAGGLAARC